MTGPLDALVIGAGPAGSTAAILLARAGRRVCLVDPGTRPATGCDVLISASGRHLLAEHGIGLPTSRPVNRLELRFGTGPAQDYTDLGAVVVADDDLRTAMADAVHAAGPDRVADRAAAVERIGGVHRVRLAGGGTLHARHVVVATGGVSGDQPGTGLCCVQRLRGPGLDDRVRLVLTPPAATRADAPPISVWALPAGADGVTVGVARIGADDRGPDELLGLALRTLAGTDPRFAAAQPVGPPRSGLLDTGFSPERVRTATGLLVGDAAGLVNPFTGEGISYAIESAGLAAQAVLAAPDNPDAAHARYRRSLGNNFVGYFETARHAARRYHLAWRILAASATSDSPFFAKGRRAVLLPEGIGGLADNAAVALPDAAAATVGPLLAGCDEVMVATVRKEWPFLARLSATGDRPSRHRVRPALLFTAALTAGGRPVDPALAPVAAAVELATLGALAFLGSTTAHTDHGGIDWATTGTVLAGDFLLAQASRLIAETAPDVCWPFADWLGELAALRADRLSPDGRTPPEAPFAALFEFPARLGGQLGGARAEDIEALREFAGHCGAAFLHAEDVLGLRGERTRLDSTLDAMRAGQNSYIPLDVPVSARDTPSWQAALELAITGCRTAEHQAAKSAAQQPEPLTAALLTRLARAIATPSQHHRIVRSAGPPTSSSRAIP